MRSHPKKKQKQQQQQKRCYLKSHSIKFNLSMHATSINYLKKEKKTNNKLFLVANMLCRIDFANTNVYNPDGVYGYLC